MGSQCCGSPGAGERKAIDPRYRRILWGALIINALMFFVELVAGLAAGSVSLQADSLDFLSDSANYVISLFVLGMTLRYRAGAALVKGVTMGLFGVWVLGAAVWHAILGGMPEALTMGVVGLAAFAANMAVFGLLWSYRNGDSNMRSVWLCSRNDAAGNLVVVLAAVGVFGTGTGWPDMIVAAIMAALALQGAWRIVGLAMTELAWERYVADAPALSMNASD